MNLYQDEAYAKAEKLVSRISCKGWDITVLRGEASNIIVFYLSHSTEDSYSGIKAELVTGYTWGSKQIVNDTEANIIRSIGDRILSLTIHEFQENFKVDGKIVINPHFQIEEKP